MRFGEPVVGRDGVAAAELRVLAFEEDTPVTLAGCVFVRFGAHAYAVGTRDHRHTAEGRLPG